MKQIDIVYPLGSGSTWNDAEIRYSLRAIQQNVSGVRNIVIVGRCPDFIDKTKVIHIPAGDPLGGINADGNIALKVLKACSDNRVSDDFLFINDDHIINRKMHAAEMPFFHKGDFASFGDDFWHNGLHRQRLKRTFEILRERGHTTFHFDLHVPILINKQQFVKTVPAFDFKKDIGYTMKSIYANPVVPDSEKVFVGSRKTKIFKHKTPEQLQSIFKQSDYIAYNDGGLNGNLKYYLNSRFPELSLYELYDKEKEPSVIIREYLEKATLPLSPQMYKQGIDLFRKYGRNANLLSLFQRRNNKHTQEKLLYKLEIKAGIL